VSNVIQLPNRTDRAPRLVMVEQRMDESAGDAAPFILDRHGQRMEGHDDRRRTEELREGLTRHEGVHPDTADAEDEYVEHVLAELHEPSYLDALRRVDWQEPTMMPEWAPPGLPADSPVWAGVVDTAFEGVRTAVTAAQRVVDGAQFAYALCRPPGHHAGPAWLGGYCYLNTAAAAAYTLCDGGFEHVAIIDVDFHFPTGTSAIVAPLERVSLGSLHASTTTEVPWRHVQPREREAFVEFSSPPKPDPYLNAMNDVIDELTWSNQDSTALVLSLGYDIVASDPHGSWEFSQVIFMEIGEELAVRGLPVCVVQEGGYALKALANCSHAFAAGILMEDDE
jgi:acetoin utilization deacetylase AcuC-like enzyme